MDFLSAGQGIAIKTVDDSSLIASLPVPKPKPKSRDVVIPASEISKTRTTESENSDSKNQCNHSLVLIVARL